MKLTLFHWALVLSLWFNLFLLFFLLFRKSSSEKARFQLKSNLLSKITHELRTPLHAVIGLSQVLEKEEALPSNLKKTVVSVKENGLYLLSLVNDFLDLSKVESGKLVLEIEQFSIHKLWDSILNLFAYRFQEKGINLSIHLIGLDLSSTFLGDFRKIQQILINLISNSLKFTEQGQVTLQIKQENNSIEVNALVDFSVIDSGKGIVSEELKTIFEPFWQSPRSDSIAGTGLGLSIAKQMVDLLGGQLIVESKLNIGSKFNFELLLSKKPSENGNKQLPLELGFEKGISPEEEKQYILSFILSLPPEEKIFTLKALQVQEYSDLYSQLGLIETEEKLGKERFLNKLKEKKTKFLIDLYSQLQRELKS